MTQPEIRRAVDGDAAAAADTLIRARGAAVPAVPASVHPDDGVRAWFRDVVMAEHEVWVAEAGDDVVGVMVLSDEWIEQLYVDAAWTGAGLGTRFVDLAKERRPGGLRLWTFESNTGAQRFYGRHGFVVQERTDGSGNEEHQPDVRYAWSST